MRRIESASFRPIKPFEKLDHAAGGVRLPSSMQSTGYGGREIRKVCGPIEALACVDWSHDARYRGARKMCRDTADGTAGLVTNLVSGRDNDVRDFTSHLGDAFGLRRVQRVQLVLRVAPLGVQALRDLDLVFERARDLATLALTLWMTRPSQVRSFLIRAACGGTAWRGRSARPGARRPCPSARSSGAA